MMDTLKRRLTVKANSPRKVKSASSKLTFEFEVSDVGLDFSCLYQPHSLVLSVARHGKVQMSPDTVWEASLKSPREGFGFWHPHFLAAVKVSISRNSFRF